MYNNNGNRTEWSPIRSLIKTITKFSNVIGYQHHILRLPAKTQSKRVHAHVITALNVID